MVIASLILASQTFILPHNEYQMDQLQTSLTIVAGASLGFIVLAVLMNRWLPHAPFLNRVMLAPLSDEEKQQLTQSESLVDFRRLVGRQGVTTTQLTPSGKARFGDELVDVIARGRIDRQERDDHRGRSPRQSRNGRGRLTKHVVENPRGDRKLMDYLGLGAAAFDARLGAGDSGGLLPLRRDPRVSCALRRSSRPWCSVSRAGRAWGSVILVTAAVRSPGGCRCRAELASRHAVRPAIDPQGADQRRRAAGRRREGQPEKPDRPA